MKKTLNFILTVFFATLLSACGNSDVKEVSVSLNLHQTNLLTMENFTLAASVENSDEAVTWSSSNENIATVNNGVIYGVSAGTCNIIASVGNSSDSCTVVVATNPVSTVLYVENNNVTIVKGDAYSMTVYATFGEEKISNPALNFTFIENNESTIASYAYEGDTLTLTGVNPGSTVLSISGNIKSTYVVEYINIVVENL